MVIKVVLYFFFILTTFLAITIKPTEGGAGDCNGGKGKYEAFASKDSAGRPKEVAGCLKKLKGEAPISYGCVTVSYRKCRCTVDSSFIVNYDDTFKEARRNLYKGSRKYQAREAERYEGKMYLTYTCRK